MADTESNMPVAAHDKKPRKRMKFLYGQIKDQMEFYFSDSNLNRDRFMKKQINDSEDGYLLLDMFLKFNKIRNLTSDTSEIAAALKRSYLLQVNEEGTKVKRSRPLSSPKDIDDRTVYVECLPHKVDHEWIKRVFSDCGNVLYVSIPRYKSTGDPKGFAFIEFDTADSAKRACEELNNPPAEASDKPGKFPRTSKQLTHLQKTLSHKETTAIESDKSLTESPTKSGRKKKRRRQTSECSTDGSEITKQRKLDYDEKDQSCELSTKEEVNLEKTNTKTDDNCDKEAKKKSKKRKRSKGECHVTDSETSIQLSESDRESLKRKKSDLDETEPPIKSSKVETVFDNKENNAENKKLLDKEEKTKEINDNSAVVGKKKKRHHKCKNKEKDIPELRVISKKEWLDLKTEYLKLQKENMNELKRTLIKLKEKDDEMQVKEEEEAAGTKKVRPKIEFTPDCIVQITSGRLMYRREIKDDLDDDYNIAYIDVKETAQSGHIRMKDSNSAKRLAEATCGHYFFSLLQGQEEKDYWEKLEADRSSKLNTKGTKKKQKGSTKLIEKAQRINKDNICRSHIKFDDD